MKIFKIVTLLTLFTATAQAEFAVVSVVRNLPMRGDDAISKDYYINAGTNNGLVKGAFLDAMRKLPVHDNLSSKVTGDTAVPIARLKLIHVDKNASIARMVKFFERGTTPVTGFEDVMVGDLVKVSDSQ